MDTKEPKQAEQKLKVSESRYRLLFETAQDAILILNGDTGAIIYANPFTQDMLGYSMGDLLGKNLFEIGELKDIPASKIIGEELQQTGYIRYDHLPMVTKDGRSISVETVANAYTVNHSRVIQCNIRDMTEIHLTMNALREAKEDLEETQRLTEIGSWKWEVSTNKVTWSKSLCLINGWDQDLPVPPFAEMARFYTDESWTQLGELVSRAFDTGEPYELEADQIRTDGTMIKTIARGEVIYDNSGKIVLLQGTVQDITEHHRVMKELRQSKEFTDTALDSQIDTFFLFEPSTGKAVRWNRSFREISGYTDHEIAGLLAPDSYYSLEDLAKAAAVWQVMDEGGATVNLDLICKDGNKVPTEYKVSAIYDDNSKIKYLVSIGRDITERKNMEEERQKFTRLDSIGNLAGGIAHDFNNILTVILGNIQLAERYLEKGETNTAREILGDAEKASLNAKTLTQQLLTFSRGGAPVKNLIQIEKLLKEAVIFALRGSNCKPKFAIARDLWEIEVDKGQLNQVLNNLVINASQATPNGGLINISARNMLFKGKRPASFLPEGRYMEIAVEDYGLGIPEGNRGKIFEPYFTTKGEGNGLGLATSYSIIKSHGGIITFESNLGVGTTFYIFLPATKEKGEEDNSKAAAVTRTSHLVKGRILIMDDEKTIRKLIGRVLQNTGYEVKLTVAGAEALKEYIEARNAGKPYDVVILDLTIPGGMGGKEVIAELLKINPDVKAIVSSGYANDPIMADYKKYGFSGVVTKPYNILEMQETLDNILIYK